MSGTVDMTLPEHRARVLRQHVIKVPALPSLNSCSCYNGWPPSMFCWKEILKPRWKAKGDRFGAAEQQKHDVGIQQNVSAFLESVTTVPCLNSPVLLYHTHLCLKKQCNCSSVSCSHWLWFWKTRLSIQGSSFGVDYIFIWIHFHANLSSWIAVDFGLIQGFYLKLPQMVFAPSLLSMLYISARPTHV